MANFLIKMRCHSTELLHLLIVFILIATLLGCDDCNNQTNDSQSITAAIIGPDGGTLAVDDSASSIYGAKIYIPPGVLAEDETFSIAQSNENIDDLDGVSIQCSPSRAFDAEIEVTIPLKKAPNEDTTYVLMVFNSEEGVFMPSDSIAEAVNGDSSVTFNVKHFSILSARCTNTLNRYGVTVEHGPYTALENPFCQRYCGECTAFAWGRALDRLGIKLIAQSRACSWWGISDANYSQHSVDNPRKNSLAIWMKPADTCGQIKGVPPYGHVAYVEEVDGNIVYINEANWGSPSFSGYTKSFTVEEIQNRDGYVLKGYLYLNSPFSDYDYWKFDNQGTEDWNARNVLSQGIFKPNENDAFWQLGSTTLDEKNDRGIISPLLNNIRTDAYNSLEIQFSVKGYFLNQAKAYFFLDGDSNWKKNPVILEWTSGTQENGRINLYRGQIPYSGRIKQVRIDFDNNSEENREIYIKEIRFNHQGLIDPNDIDNDGDGYTENQGDCNDQNRDINPNATEVCGDGIDQDCDGLDQNCLPDPNDIDDDGDGYSENQGDCNDLNKYIGPDVIENCSDMIDNDCDSYIDCDDPDCNGAPACQTCTDTDNDEYYAESGCGSQVDCNDNDSSVHPGATEICDDKDNDCDGFIDEGSVCQTCTDADSDEYYKESGCGTAVDCNDNNSSINPGASEICGDGIDQDCDGTDEECKPDPHDVDNDGDGYTVNQGDCNDKNKSIHPGASETCNDIDDDCDGQIDEERACPTCTDLDGDGYYAESGCGKAVDCNDNDSSIHPGATEIYDDGIDQDCDGSIDEGMETGFTGIVYEAGSWGTWDIIIPGTRIVFTSEDGTFSKQVESDSSGRYRIALSAGRYTVTANHPDYHPYSTGSGFFVCNGSGWQTGNFSLYALTPDHGDDNNNSDFEDNNDGTVTDHRTGLIWQQQTVSAIDWYESITYCEDLNLAGQSDWRLPTQDELLTIVNKKYTPSIDPVFFPDTIVGLYWSSDETTNTALGVHFYGGYKTGAGRNGINNMRAVYRP